MTITVDGSTNTITGATSLVANTVVTGTFGASGNVAINTDKLTVAAASGNTVVAGTLAVNGATLSTDDASFTALAGATTLLTIGGTGATAVVAIPGTLEWSTTTGALTVAGGVYIAKKAMVIGDFGVATNKFTVAAASGNTLVAGTLAVNGAALTTDDATFTALAGATTLLTLGGTGGSAVVAIPSTLEWSTTTGALTVAGGVYIAKKLQVISDFSVNTNKFTVAAASGNTLVAGTLNVTLDAKIASAKALVQGMTNFPLHSITSLTSAATVTYTAAQVLSGLISDAISEANAATFPAPADVVAAIAGCAVGTSFDFYVKNAAASGISITLTAGAGNTLVGTATIAQNNTKHVRAIVTNITGASEAVTYYSLSTAVH